MDERWYTKPIGKVAKRKMMIQYHYSYSLMHTVSANPLSYIHTCTHTHTHTRTYTHTPTLYTNTCTHTHTHTDTFRNPKDGAATTINCAVNPHLNSQQAYYYADCRPKEPSATARYIMLGLWHRTC